MLEINVLVPKTGKPLVMDDTEAVVTGRPFVWAIKNEHPDVDVVGIEFPGGETYFPGSSGPQARCEKLLVNDRATIWSMAPRIGQKNVTKPAKYTVYGKDASGNIVCDIDPMILPTDPP